MTNTKQLQAAVAFLASIAILDNFIFIELETDSESMVLVEHSGSQAGQMNHYAESKAIWGDREIVSTVKSAIFLESSYLEPQVATPSNKLVFENQSDKF
tara:strand:- start:10589 stop:10885 length:297 start_codon:yes stop_codon:yes gene_type:complete